MKWYEKSQSINCTYNRVKEAADELGTFFLEVNKGMPGLTSVELISSGQDVIEIKTNEGMMQRGNILKEEKDGILTISFNEVYITSGNLRIESKYSHVFTKDQDQVVMALSIEEVKSKGVLGFMYKTFGKENIGKAVLKAYKDYLEQLN